ncbi:MAG: M90 family metallopeptidase [Pseudomonadales bacterium]
MNSTLGYFSLVSAVAVLGFVYWLWRYRKRQQFIHAPFPQEWDRILRANIPVYQRLSEPLRQQLQGHIRQFIHDKEFIGCGGLEINSTIQLTIAAGAAMLLLNRPTTGYSSLRWIYVYPSSFVTDREQRDDSGVVSSARVGTLGESWSNGKLVLSWNDAEQGIHDFTDGHNVILHEFAHQLDGEQQGTNGAPVLDNPGAYKVWTKVLSGEFENLQRKASVGSATVIDKYGATNPAEFFAVATEAFFERPEDMARHHTSLFNVLTDFYKVDPRDWL